MNRCSGSSGKVLLKLEEQSIWEMVFLMHYYGMFLSLFHSVQICQAEGIPLEQFIALLGEQGKHYEKWLCENILSGNYQETSSPLELWAGGIRQIAQHAEESGIHADFPQRAPGMNYSARLKSLEPSPRKTSRSFGKSSSFSWDIPSARLDTENQIHAGNIKGSSDGELIRSAHDMLSEAER